VNALVHLPQGFDWQVTSIYLAPDLIPQGRIGQRYLMDMGLKKTLKKGELFINATDLLNTMNIQKTINGTGFTLNSTDFYETQVVRLGYSRKL
jgi:hypothetical protein